MFGGRHRARHYTCLPVIIRNDTSMALPDGANDQNNAASRFVVVVDCYT